MIGPQVDDPQESCGGRIARHWNLFLLGLDKGLRESSIWWGLTAVVPVQSVQFVGRGRTRHPRRRQTVCICHFQ
jgi:hypothetical protein